MNDYEIDRIFQQIAGPVEDAIEAEHEADRKAAFHAEPRPVPDGLNPVRPPAGHIALQKGFEEVPPEPKNPYKLEPPNQ